MSGSLFDDFDPDADYRQIPLQPVDATIVARFRELQQTRQDENALLHRDIKRFLAAEQFKEKPRHE